MRLKRSTTLAFDLLFVVKKWMLFSLSKLQELRLRNSVPLSVCTFSGDLPRSKIDWKPLTTDSPILFLSGTTQANFENRSMQVSKNICIPCQRTHVHQICLLLIINPGNNDCFSENYNELVYEGSRCNQVLT